MTYLNGLTIILSCNRVRIHAATDVYTCVMCVVVAQVAAARAV